LKEEINTGYILYPEGDFFAGVLFTAFMSSKLVITYTVHRSSTTVTKATRKGLANSLSESF